VKNKTDSNQKNKDKIWHKIKLTKILKDAIKKIIQLKNNIKY
jgi:hypothetical protein